MNQRAIDKYFKYNAREGRFVPEESRRYILPFESYFDLSDQAGAYSLPATGTPAKLVAWKQAFSSANGMDANLGTPLHIRDLKISDTTSFDTLDFTVVLTEVGETRLFMNKPVHVRTIFGDAKYPGEMPEKYMFASQHQIQAQFVNLGAARTIRPYLAGAQYYPFAAQTDESRNKVTKLIRYWNLRRSQVWPFWLTTQEPISLTAGQEASFELLAGQDATFIAKRIACVSTGNFEYSLMEVKTGHNLSNGRATFTNSLGDARLPRRLPYDYVVPPGTALKT